MEVTKPGPFDVEKIKISGNNLIEASAGTGKTYSIAILLLRRILEEGKKHESIADNEFFLKKILMVTFTNAAVAELKTRVREFIKAAYDYASGKEIKDKVIIAIVNTYKQDVNTIWENVLKNLKATLLNIDELQISTIHGFASQILSEFAFETRLSFGAAVQNDVDDIIDFYVNEYYRQEITTLDVEILNEIQPDKFRKNIKEIINKIMADKVYLSYSEFKDKTKEEIEKEIEDLKRDIDSSEQETNEYFNNHKEEVKVDVINAKIDGRTTLCKSAKSGNFESIVSEYIKHKFKKTSNITELLKKLEFNSFWSRIDELHQLRENKSKLEKVSINYFKYKAITTLLPKIEKKIEELDILTFDSIILHLRNELKNEENKRLVELISSKYDTVFIDEFQDTDQAQAEIFDQLFINNPKCTVFMIGDPKQSIYAFRNSDIDSYLSIKGKMDNRHSMGINYRSSKDMVAAINQLYSTIGATKGFLFDEGKISYEIVTAADQEIHFFKGGEQDRQSLQLFEYERLPDAQNNLAAAVAQLLNPENEYKILDKKTKELRAIKTSDIGILVERHDEGEEIKGFLAQYNIPAVKLKSGKVLETDEAQQIILIIEAMQKADINSIRKALLLSFLRKDKDVADYKEWYFGLDENEALQIFAEYKSLLNKNDLINALNKVLADFSIRQQLSNNQLNQRQLSNIEQIIQLVHQQQYQNGWDVEQTLNWLKIQNSGKGDKDDEDNSNGDDYEMQIESDEEAVKITTIHSSKGLEYNIVFIAGIERDKKVENGKLFDFKISENNQRVFDYGEMLSAEDKSIANLQMNQERARLIYVALTRAVYRTYVFYSKHNKNSVWKKFADEISTTEYISKISKEELEAVSIDADAIESNTINTSSFSKDKAAKSRSEGWKMSYSALSDYTSHSYLRTDKIEDTYEKFIFNQLPRGKRAGSILHELFEHLDFTQIPNEWEAIDPIAKKKLEAFNKPKLEQDYTENIKKMVEHTLQAEIAFEGQDSFQLNQIPKAKRLIEMQFNFHVKTKEDFQQLKDILEKADATIKEGMNKLSGMMTGFIDLFFEHKGKYYILDWKSNYIGYKLEDYQQEQLREAMKQSTYHLQYLIYTVAICKYLKNRKADFDYEKDFGGVIYVYLRGTRKGQKTGIFTHKPTKETIEQIDQLLNQ